MKIKESKDENKSEQEYGFTLFESKEIILERKKKEKTYLSCSGSGRIDKNFAFNHLEGLFGEDD